VTWGQYLRGYVRTFFKIAFSRIQLVLDQFEVSRAEMSLRVVYLGTCERLTSETHYDNQQVEFHNMYLCAIMMPPAAHWLPLAQMQPILFS
jgi:hypothetical protein